MPLYKSTFYLLAYTSIIILLGKRPDWLTVWYQLTQFVVECVLLILLWSSMTFEVVSWWRMLVGITVHSIIMRPSSLGGGRILRCTLSVRLSVRPSRYHSVASCHLANYNDTHVLFGRHRGPHIVRPSRPHKLVYFVVTAVVLLIGRDDWGMLSDLNWLKRKASQ